MDIVSRLKKFISYLKIPVTQFADSCGIPRPTLSQLLNGRNKKVSDELISKIHEVYPSLSVLWLMFGEGDMLHQENIKISEPETRSIFDFSESEQTVSEPNTPSIDFKIMSMKFRQKNFLCPRQRKIGTQARSRRLRFALRPLPRSNRRQKPTAAVPRFRSMPTSQKRS